MLPLKPPHRLLSPVHHLTACTADVADSVASFLAQATASQGDGAAAGADGADEQAAAPKGGRARKGSKQRAAAQQPAAKGGPMSLESLKQLQASLAAGKQAGVLSQADPEQLRQLLLVLLPHVQAGQELLLTEVDAVRSGVHGVARLLLLLRASRHTEPSHLLTQVLRCRGVHAGRRRRQRRSSGCCARRGQLLHAAAGCARSAHQPVPG